MVVVVDPHHVALVSLDVDHEVADVVEQCRDHQRIICTLGLSQRRTLQSVLELADGLAIVLRATTLEEGHDLCHIGRTVHAGLPWKSPINERRTRPSSGSLAAKISRLAA